MEYSESSISMITDLSYKGSITMPSGLVIERRVGFDLDKDLLILPLVLYLFNFICLFFIMLDM